MAQICKEIGDTCYGVNLMSNPANSISRDSLKEYYQYAINEARSEVGLDMDVPIVVVDSLTQAEDYWLNG